MNFNQAPLGRGSRNTMAVCPFPLPSPCASSAGEALKRLFKAPRAAHPHDLQHERHEHPNTPSNAALAWSSRMLVGDFGPALMAELLVLSFAEGCCRNRSAPLPSVNCCSTSACYSLTSTQTVRH